MTDNEIIKALENCISANCSMCPHRTEDGCTDALMQDTLSLINRQKEEIERSERDVFTYKIRWAKAEIRETKAKAEAIKEFAERLKESDGYNNHTFDDCASILVPEEYRKGRDEKIKEFWNMIDNLVKEMVGEQQ